MGLTVMRCMDRMPAVFRQNCVISMFPAAVTHQDPRKPLRGQPQCQEDKDYLFEMIGQRSPAGARKPDNFCLESGSPPKSSTELLIRVFPSGLNTQARQCQPGFPAWRPHSVNRIGAQANTIPNPTLLRCGSFGVSC